MQPALVGLVVVGGTVGTALRDRLETVFATPAGELPWATFGINVSGAFLLGLLVEVLAVAYLMASVLAGFAAACGAMAMTRWAVRAWGKGAGP